MLPPLLPALTAAVTALFFSVVVAAAGGCCCGDFTLPGRNAARDGRADETEIVLFEPKATAHTGEVQSDRTEMNQDWI